MQEIHRAHLWQIDRGQRLYRKESLPAAVRGWHTAHHQTEKQYERCVDERFRHRCFDNFIVSMLGAIAAYCNFPKKPCINLQRTLDTQLALF